VIMMAVVVVGCCPVVSAVGCRFELPMIEHYLNSNARHLTYESVNYLF
jgi:hypothetical protein